MKSLLLVITLTIASYAQLNFTGWNDTSNITDFKADSLKYTKAFPLSLYENIRVDVIFDDPSATGRGSDSAKFYYWLETGHPVKSLTGTLDTVWSVKDPLIIDTVDALTAGNFAISARSIASDGTYNYPLKTIDTVSFAVGGGSVQSRSFQPEWDTYYRIGFKGLTGNNKDAFLSLKASNNRRVGMPVRIQ